MKDWIKQTLSDNQGKPSFKKQAATLLILYFVIDSTINSPNELLVYFVLGLLGLSVSEKFNKNK